MVRSLVLVVGLAMPMVAAAGGIPLLAADQTSHGSVSASLSKGAVRMKITGLPMLPATQPLGATFDAYVYKAYLSSSADPAVEIFLADVYPNGAGAAKLKVVLKGDVSAMGFDHVALTAFSKDARDSVDVLTATLQ